jgi:hypothetical protein
LQAYTDPADLQPLIESKDYLGTSMLGIISKSQMFKVLDTKIMDRIVKEKWNGINNETRSIVEYSTGYQVIHDKYERYVGLGWPKRICELANTWDKSEISHIFKYFIWKKSMLLRLNIEFIIVIIYSLVFLELIIVFIGDLHIA